MNKEKRTAVVTFLAAALMIGTAAGGFYGSAEAAVKVENSKVVTLPTAYPAVMDLSVSPEPSKPPETEETPAKADYTLVDNELEYYRDKHPTANDISREEAAAIGVKALEEVYGVDLAGKEIEMAYNPADDRGFRAYWQGIWWITHEGTPGSSYPTYYFFSVDAITGERMTVQNPRNLDVEVDVGFDPAFEKSEGADHVALAKEAALKFGAIEGAVKEVEYGGQGSVNNDPNVVFNLTGEKGDRAQIALSRYDNAIQAIVFDAGVREMDVAEREAEAFAKRAEAYYAANPGATSYEEF